MSDFTPSILTGLTKLVLFSLMFSLGLTVSYRQVLSLWQRPGLLNRAILGMSVVAPLLAIGVGFAMDLPAEVKMGLVLVSLSPSTSLPLHYLFKAVKRHLYTQALQTTAAFLSITTVPLTIAIINEILPESVQIAPLAVVQQMFVFQLLPLMIGLMIGVALRPYYANAIERSTKFLVAGATLLLYGLLVWALVQQFNILLELGIPSMVAIAVLAFVSLWIGDWIGGKEIAARTLLALTLSSHNIALALLIAIANLPNIAIPPVIAAYTITSAGFAIVYFQWSQRRFKTIQS